MGNRDKIRQFKQAAGSLSGQMSRLFKKCANERGNQTEDHVEEAVQALYKEGNRGIASFYIEEKWSRGDRRGKDLHIFWESDGHESIYQIKSSLAGIEKHLKQQEKFGGERIIPIYGSYLLGETFEEYKERIFRNITENTF